MEKEQKGKTEELTEEEKVEEKERKEKTELTESKYCLEQFNATHFGFPIPD